MTIAKQQRAAKFYVHGPAGVRGVWRVACEQAGYKRPPPIEKLRHLIESEGGSLPEDAPRVSEVEIPEFELPDANAADAEWDALAVKLMPTYIAIARGDANVNPAQARVLQSIMDRVYGKVGQKRDVAPTEAAVVILPALGSNADLQVCPNCAARLR